MTSMFTFMYRFTVTVHFGKGLSKRQEMTKLSTKEFRKQKKRRKSGSHFAILPPGPLQKRKIAQAYVGFLMRTQPQKVCSLINVT